MYHFGKFTYGFKIILVSSKYGTHPASTLADTKFSSYSTYGQMRTIVKKKKVVL